MSLSIGQRLAAMFALVSFTVFAVLGVALYQMLSCELVRHQQTELNTRWELYEHKIAGITKREQWRFIRGLFDTLTADDERTHYWILSDDPDFTYGTPLAGARALTARGDGLGELVIDGRPAPLKTLLHTVEASGERPAVKFMIGVDSAPFVQTLDTFTRWLTLLAVTGALLATALGYYIASLSLRPLERASREAQQLSPMNLSQRLQTKKLPPELSRFTASFNGALERLEASYQQLHAFNADVAHELRTPLANIIGQTQVTLSRERDVADLRETLHSNLEELDRLRDIVNNMLFLARADRGETARICVETSLAHEVGRTIEFLEPTAEEAGVHVRVDGDARAAIQSALFQRAVANLLQNAVQHTTRGSNILVSISQESDGARVTVRNKGAQISASHLARVFDRFYRTDPARGGSGDNHGLGLAVVKAVAAMHGGTVFARSENGITSIGFTVARGERNLAQHCGRARGLSLVQEPGSTPGSASDLRGHPPV